MLPEPGRQLAGFAAIASSPDGRRLATGNWDHKVTVWAAETGAEIFTRPLVRC